VTQKKSVSQTQSISLSFQGLVIGMILVFPAMLSMDIGNAHFGFSFLPVTVLYFWPRAASHTGSLLSVFLLGAFYDMVSANTLGMWALAFLIVFLVLDNAPTVTTGLGRAIVGFILSLGLCFFVVLLVGWILEGQLPQVGTMFLNAVATIMVFPIIYWAYNTFNIVRGSSNVLGAPE